MTITDRELLRKLDKLLPVRARLVTQPGGGKGWFELSDRHSNEIVIDGISPLRIIAVLRKHDYPEVFKEIDVFGGEIVFSKLALCSVRTKREPHPLDDSPFVQNFF